MSLSTRLNGDDAAALKAAGATRIPSPTDVPVGARVTGGATSTIRPRRVRRRSAIRRVISGLAAVLVLFALLSPNRQELLTPLAFVRIPLEALVFAGLLLVLPARATRVQPGLAVLAGLGLGLLLIVKCLDFGFYAVLNRPFDPLLDLQLTGGAVDFLTDSIGRAGAIGVAAAVVALIVTILALVTLSVRRLTPVLVTHRSTSLRAVGVLAVVWLIVIGLGVKIAPPIPVASWSAAAIAFRHVRQVPEDLHDAKVFAKESKVDAFRDTPADQMLTGLRGKDVLVTFIESYGRSAIERPELAPGIDKVLDEGSAKLRAAGFGSRSGFLTSPTAGGGSWLAQSTLLSGLWIKNEKRYDSFIASDRLTLNGAFGRADWRTLAVAPGVKKKWPEARVFGFDKIYDARHLGYQGPHFSWSWVPDQYVLSTFEKTEHATKDRAPLMAEIPLTSSHMPWTPLPKAVDWNDIGDGSIYAPMALTSGATTALYSNPPLVRARYAASIEYSLSTLISYVQKYGDDNMVLVFLGDHQPFPMVAGPNASHDVPITIVAKDPAVLDTISSWGWQDGLNPGPDAPVWPMSSFRDRFLTAFGSTPTR